jgi:hypothetical protein
LLATWALLSLLEQKIFIGLPFLTIALFLAASGISLGNWMDRRTRLILRQDGVHFENGLRNIDLKWVEIQAVQVSRSGWGDRVRVIGKQKYFAFRTLGEVKLSDEVKGRMGFAEGAFILSQILEKSGLEADNAGQSDSNKFYKRQ